MPGAFSPAGQYQALLFMNAAPAPRTTEMGANGKSDLLLNTGKSSFPSNPLSNGVPFYGSGPFAITVAKALNEAKGFDVTIVGRRAKDVTAPGTVTKIVPAWDVDGLAEAFAGADFVISTLSLISITDPQFAVIKAAKNAGVKGITLSEYGVPVTAYPTSPLGGLKLPARALAQQVGLPWIAIINGGFLDNPFGSFIRDDENKVATVFGSPDVKLSLTSREDVAAYLAQILFRFNDFKNGEVQVSAVTTTVRELVTKIGKVKGISYSIISEPLEETEAKSAANKADRARFFGTIIAKGFMLNNNDVSSQFPSVQPKGLDYWLPKHFGV
ncbi:hypothetical protein HDU93_005887 [Gonapodya sp. JEL0774]|nr:hypothetical protein HDU93_005887 [Gonapodya sp. JEL0774]